MLTSSGYGAISSIAPAKVYRTNTEREPRASSASGQSKYDSVTLSWNCLNPDAMVDIYVSSTNQYKEGGKDQWKKIARVPAKKQMYVVSSDQLPDSHYYKFVLETPNNHLNRWVQ